MNDRARRRDVPRGSRQACPQCDCEISHGPEPARVGVPGQNVYRQITVEEPALKFDELCACRCHEIWKFMFRGRPSPERE